MSFFIRLYLWKPFSILSSSPSAATLISLTIGRSCSSSMPPRGRVGKFLILFYGNLVIPETVLAVSLLGFFSLSPFLLGLQHLILAHTVLGLGLCHPHRLCPLYRARLPHDRGFSGLRGNPHPNFFKVTLPLLRPRSSSLRCSSSSSRSTISSSPIFAQEALRRPSPFISSRCSAPGSPPSSMPFLPSCSS